GEGRPFRAAELVVDRVAPAHHRGAHFRDPGGEEGSAGDAGRRRNGRNVLDAQNSEFRIKNSECERPGRSKPAGPFVFAIDSVRVFVAAVRSQRDRRCYRSVNESSMVICTETGWPIRVPGEKRHCLAALTASLSSPKVGSSDRMT